MIDYQELKQLEDELWTAADQLRANSKLTASEYSMPVLGLIFLRHATTRFNALLPQIEALISAKADPAMREELIQLEFQGRAAIYLPEKARYDYLADLPASANLGQSIVDAMLAIESSVVDQNDEKLLAGALPKDYLTLGQELDGTLLADLLKIFNSPTLQKAEGDVFGRIYEYFLNQFAQSGAQEGGEFFTPPSLVRMIVNVIEPDHGIVLDPACGSAGMFVQTGHFMEEVRHQNTHDNIVFYGQEKADLNSKLARMNLAVHGLDGKIRIGNTFYEDHHDLVGKCDFVMANPPFNVDGVQVNRISDQVGDEPGARLPFGLPGSTGKSKAKDKGGSSEAVSNANSLWIQYFYSYLNESGRAGFVMASSASDAGNKDKEIRQQLVETGHVDVMISIGPKFFYTRSLPCMLWFYDKGKPDDLLDSVLMIDARNVYTTVSARSHVFTDEQLANLTAITWLYRGEHDKVVALLAHYQQQMGEALATLPKAIKDDDAMVAQLVKAAVGFAALTADAKAVAQVREKLGKEHGLDDALLAGFQTEVAALQAALPVWAKDVQAALTAGITILDSTKAAAKKDSFATRKKAQAICEQANPAIKAGLVALEARHKAVLKVFDKLEKNLRARQWSGFKDMGEGAREAKKALLPRDVKKREARTVRDIGVEALKRTSYFVAQGHWLLSRFPDGTYADVPGLCKQVSRADIAQNNYSLTPGGYVGVAAGGKGDDDDGAAFKARMTEIHAELAELNEKAAQLAAQISATFAELVE